MNLTDDRRKRWKVQRRSKKYYEDPRNGVQKLVALAQKKLDALEKEKQRIENLKKYEKEYAGYTYICGID